MPLNRHSPGNGTPASNGGQMRKPLRISPPKPQPQPAEPAKEVPAPAPEIGEFKNLETPELIAILNSEHRAFLGCLRRGLKDHARRAGAALTVLKGRLQHGSWGEWVKKNFKGSPAMEQL